MSGQTQRSGDSVIFTGEGTHAESSGEVDEVARSWPQLMSLLTQLVRHLHTATSDGSMKLPRRQIGAMRRHGINLDQETDDSDWNGWQEAEDDEEVIELEEW